MKKRIGDIANIRSGFFFRSQLKGVATYLQAKHFDNIGELKESLIPDLSEKELTEKHLLQKGDILVSAKGTRNIATMYKESYGPCVASSTFFIVTLASDLVGPEYLVIVLNEALQTPYFQAHFSGSTVPSIPKSILAEYTIPLPSKKTQQDIVAIYKIYKEQLSLYESLKNKKSHLIRALVLSSS